MTTNTIESTLYHRVDNNEANLAEKSAVVCLQSYEPIKDKDGRYLLRSDETSVVHSIEEASQIIRRSLITGGAKMPSQQVITEAGNRANRVPHMERIGLSKVLSADFTELF